MSYRDHTTTCGCWCDPIIAHVRGNVLVVTNPRDAERLKIMGITQGVVVSPDVPTQRGGGTSMSGGENGDQ